MPEPTKKPVTGKKKLGVYVTLTPEQRKRLDEIGLRDLYQPDAAGDVLRIFINKYWKQIVGEKAETGEPNLFPES
jgi:hypothetical protein